MKKRYAEKNTHGFVISMLLFVTACDENQKVQAEEPLRPVRTIIASASDGITGRDFPGIVIAQNRADLSFRVSGKLKELLIKEGDQVTKGQIIARLDQTDFKIELDDKQANYEKAKANFIRSAKLLEPMTIAIMAGLLFSTLLTLGVVPVLYALLFRVRPTGS